MGEVALGGSAPHNSAMAHRRDYSRIDKVEGAPGGAIRVQSTPTRSGVLEYRQPDGSVFREWRCPEEVFAKDSLDTLRGAPITIGHPPPVTPDTWRSVAVGHFGDDVRKDGRMVAGDLVVSEASALAAVLDRTLVELSCGYDCEVEVTAGVTPEGERYDGIQRNIRYNHVALLPVGAARAGREARIRMDAAEADVEEVGANPPKEDSKGGGSSPEVAPPNVVAHSGGMTLEEAIKALEAAKADAAAEKARADEATAKLVEADKARTDAVDALPAKIEARVGLEKDVAVVAPDFNPRGKTDRECLEAGADRKDGSDDFLRGCLALRVSGEAASAKRRADALKVATESKADTEESEGDKARAEYLARFKGSN